MNVSEDYKKRAVGINKKRPQARRPSGLASIKKRSGMVTLDPREWNGGFDGGQRGGFDGVRDKIKVQKESNGQEPTRIKQFKPGFNKGIIPVGNFKEKTQQAQKNEGLGYNKPNMAELIAKMKYKRAQRAMMPKKPGLRDDIISLDPRENGPGGFLPPENGGGIAEMIERLRGVMPQQPTMPQPGFRDEIISLDPRERGPGGFLPPETDGGGGIAEMIRRFKEQQPQLRDGIVDTMPVRPIDGGMPQPQPRDDGMISLDPRENGPGGFLPPETGGGVPQQPRDDVYTTMPVRPADSPYNAMPQPQPRDDGMISLDPRESGPGGFLPPEQQPSGGGGLSAELMRILQKKRGGREQQQQQVGDRLRGAMQLYQGQPEQQRSHMTRVMQLLRNSLQQR